LSLTRDGLQTPISEKAQGAISMSNTEQPVDLDHLDRYTGGDRAINREILLLFETQCREMIAKLEHLSSGENDAKSWHHIAHTLKGAARGIGAFALGDAAAEAEKTGSEKDATLAALQRLKHTSAAVHVFIADFLKNGG
jgi:HPt (histidine-containing phosphotransfer) domain-containing protein